MAKESMMTGCRAAAEGAKAAEVEVICSYPIRPYTAIMMELAKMVANGELNAEFIHGEGEHAQVSVVLGASAAGARAYTGSSGVGVTYAMEVYSPMAGGRYPVQMSIADRTLDPPGDFGSEHTDAMSTRDQGWLLGWAATPQEVYDNTLMSYRIGEDHRVMLPQMVCQDGYFISHIPDNVTIGEGLQVKEFLPPYRPDPPPEPHEPGFPRSADPPRPGRPDGRDARADVPRGSQGHRRGDGRFRAHLRAQVRPVRRAVQARRRGHRVLHHGRAFQHRPGGRGQAPQGRRQGRHGAAALGAPVAYPSARRGARPCQGRRRRRDQHLLRIGAMRGGNLIHELRASLYDLDNRPLVTSFMGGLGGETIWPADFDYMAGVLTKMVKEKRTDRYVYWLGM